MAHPVFTHGVAPHFYLIEASQIYRKDNDTTDTTTRQENGKEEVRKIGEASTETTPVCEKSLT